MGWRIMCRAASGAITSTDHIHRINWRKPLTDKAKLKNLNDISVDDAEVFLDFYFIYFLWSYDSLKLSIKIKISEEVVMCGSIGALLFPFPTLSHYHFYYAILLPYSDTPNFSALHSWLS